LTKEKANFSELLLEAIDEALSSLGESQKTAIYYHLKKEFNIKRLEIPERVEDFSRALERIFGLGARHLEILFMKSLYAKLGGVCEWTACEWTVPKLTFQEYVRLMKQKLEEACKNEEEIEVLMNAAEEQEQHI
jgi:hypothetical protein